MATITVTLNVRTTKLHYKKDVDIYCSFAGMANGANPELFTTKVRSGDTIVWNGVSIDTQGDQADTVEIIDITRYGGNKILSNFSHPTGSTVSCTVSGEKFMWQKYNIFFTINNDNTKKYKIDPIINIYQ